MRSLPSFERCGAWKATRSYYAIDRTIRHAAQQYSLSGVLLQTCEAPFYDVPRKMVVEEQSQAESSAKRAYDPSALAKMRTRADENAELQPTYLALEVFEPEFMKRQLEAKREEFGSMAADDGYVYPRAGLNAAFTRHHWRLPRNNSVLTTVRMVELLAAAPFEGSAYEARSFVEELRRLILRFWSRLGIEDGVVRVTE